MGFTNSISYNAANYMEAVFAPTELANRNAVLQDTWWHLAPKKNCTYRGFIVFTHTVYGDLELIDADFSGLSDSPWLFDAMQNFCFKDLEIASPGGVYRFDGSFRNYVFRGRFTALYKSNIPQGETK